MDDQKSNQRESGGVPRRHAPDWVQKEAVRTQRYYSGQPLRSEEQSDLYEAVIPTKNKQALMGYYIAVFSLIPLFGLGLGPIAIWRGFRGWKAIEVQPELPGKAHAIVAITLGSITTVMNWGVFIFVSVMIFSGRH